MTARTAHGSRGPEGRSARRPAPGASTGPGASPEPHEMPGDVPADMGYDASGEPPVEIPLDVPLDLASAESHGRDGAGSSGPDTSRARSPAPLAGIDADAPDALFGRSTAVLALLEGPEHRLLVANHAFHKVFGTGPSAVGSPLARSMPEPAGRHLLALLDQVYRSGAPRSGQDLPVRLECGGRSTEAYLDLTVEPRRDAGGRVLGVRVLGIDTTPLKHTQALAAEQRALLEQIARHAPVQEVLDALTRVIEELAPGVLASVLLADPDGTHLRHGAAPSLPRFYNDAMDGIAIGEGMGSCGTAAHRREPVVVADIAADPFWNGYHEVARRAGVASCWSTPILSASGELLGTFALYHRVPHTPDAADLALSASFARIAGLAVERHRAEEARAQAEEKEKAAREDLAFLLEAGTALTRDLDYEQTLQHLARLCVPGLAPVCVIDAVSGGRLRRIAAVAADGRQQDLLASGGHGVGAVVGSGDRNEPEATRIGRGAPPVPGHWQALDVSGHVRIPLRERARTYGTLTLLSTGADVLDWRRIALAEELAHRASTVARNARQYHDRARLAHDLQAGLLLTDMPELPGGELAAYYRPAGEGLDIGGDFYDVFPLPGDRWAFMIGDVCGRGALAATITALVRHTARAVAPLLPDPVAVTAAINKALLDRAPGGAGGDFVTLVYGHLAPRPDHLAIDLVRAGHVMPVHHRPGRDPTQLATAGMLLGAFPDAAPEPFGLPLLPGESLVLTTDGITEARDRTGAEFGDDGITRALAAPPPPAAAREVLAALIRAVTHHTSGVPTDDDQAVLILTARPPSL